MTYLENSLEIRKMNTEEKLNNLMHEISNISTNIELMEKAKNDLEFKLLVESTKLKSLENLAEELSNQLPPREYNEQDIPF